MKTYYIPYGTDHIPVQLPEEQVAFLGEMPQSEAHCNWQQTLYDMLDRPVSGAGLSEQLAPGQKIVILVEDNTRHTPVKEILPILHRYLTEHGCREAQLQILISPGTHRIMTAEELEQKLGRFGMEHFQVAQHDYREESCLVALEPVSIGGMEIPVLVNRIAVEADLLIGIGNIIPHPNAGFSGGAKILDPGCCGKQTVSATHTAAALMGYLPLGIRENACRHSMEEVAKRVGLHFIINVVLDAHNRVCQVVTGDVVDAHRRGAVFAKALYGVPIPAPADILISCSYPYDIDYWQCEKALISGYFAVKRGGIIILAAPCVEGMAHNHDDLLMWLQLSREEAERRLRQIHTSGGDGDLVAAGIAIGALTVQEKADIYIYTSGLSKQEVDCMGYRMFDSLQAAIDAARIAKPGGRIGILPRGGDCLPFLCPGEQEP